MGKKYNLIYADPPWAFNNKKTGGSMTSGSETQYEVMKINEIKALPVAHIAADDSVLLMWWVASQPAEALAVCNAWGFKVKTMSAFNWVKRTKHDKPFFGMGFWSRCLCGETKVYILTAEKKVIIESIKNLQNYNFDEVKIWTHCGWKKILNWWRNGETSVSKIVTVNSEITCSEKHVFPFKEPISKRAESYLISDKRKTIHQLSVGTTNDIIKAKNKSIVRRNGHSVNLLFSKTPVESTMPVVDVNGFGLSCDLGWIIGLFVAEGDIRKNSVRFSLHRKEEEYTNRIEKYIDSLCLFGDRYINTRLVTHTYISGNRRATHFTKSSIADLFQVFVRGKTSKTKRLNVDLLLQTSAAFRASFIRGVVDGDGHYETQDRWKLVLCNEKLIVDTKLICESICIPCSLYYPSPSYKGKTLCYKYGLRKLSAKSKSCIELNGGETGPLTIKSLEKQETSIETYDIQVEGEYFVANNIITHNSGSELCLLGTRGKPKPASHSVRSVVEAVNEQHSKKPDSIRDYAVELCGDVPRIELFARQKTAGWDSLGIGIDGKKIEDSLASIIGADK